MAGVEQVLAPTIMKCALGGWIVVIPGRGISGKTDLAEAVAFLEDQAYDIFGERRNTIPAFLERPREQPPDDLSVLEGISMAQFYRAAKKFYKRVPPIVNNATAAVAAILGVRVLGN